MRMRRQGAAVVVGLALAIGLMSATAQEGGGHTHGHGGTTGTTAATPTEFVRWSQAFPDARPTDEIVIASGRVVQFDVPHVVEVGQVVVEAGARLVFADERDLHLVTGNLIVFGSLEIGTADAPFSHRAVITLTGAESEVNLYGMGTKAIMVHGGATLDLHSAFNGTSWTRLTVTAPAGINRIVVEAADGWRVGDEIVIAPSGYDYQEAEARRITAIDGTTITLDRPLDYTHFGQIVRYGGVPFDMRAEVGLLTRPIRIEGDASSAGSLFGGQLVGMAGAVMRVHGVELTRMGQVARLGRYPIHFHLAGDVDGSYVTKSAIHRTYNRGMTIHGTERWYIADNVIYDTIGHSYFFEDGVERFNVLERNLGLLTRRPSQPLIPSDAINGQGPATFWLSNPNNILRDNVAAGSAGTGFWIDPPPAPTGDSAGRDMRPQHEPMGEFSGNVAHSNGMFGIFIEPHFTPRDYDILNATVYKNRSHGMWIDANGVLFGGGRVTVRNGRLADNGTGILMLGFGRVVDTVYVGSSANSGDTPHVDYQPDAAVIGHRFYDGPTEVINSVFVNYTPSATRPAGAFGWRAPLVAGRTLVNTVQGIRLIDSNPVYISPRPDLGANADVNYPSLPFIDLDGSLTGQAGAQVASVFPLMWDDNAIFMPAWNAYIVLDPIGMIRHACGGGCPTTVIRDDGAWGTVGADGRFNLLLNRAYTFYRNDTSCSFEITLNAPRAGDAVDIAVPYTCALSEVVLEPGGVRLRDAGSVAGVSAEAYHHDTAAGLLYLRLVQPRDNTYTETGINAFSALRISGTGTNAIIPPPVR